MTDAPTAEPLDVTTSRQPSAEAPCSPLVLSLFPGIGLLDRAFEDAGFAVVRGPDLLWGGDVKRFHAVPGRFDGVIGGPPCQAFSPLVNVNIAQGREPAENLIPEFERICGEAQPDWFVMENSTRAPIPRVDGYFVHSVVINNRWLGERQNRVRRFSFGARQQTPLWVTELALEHPHWEPAVTTSVGGRRRSVNPTGKGRQNRTFEATEIARDRSIEEECELQGLPRDFLKDCPLTREGKKRVVGNGVPLPMGRAIARAVWRAVYGANEQAEQQ